MKTAEEVAKELTPYNERVPDTPDSICDVECPDCGKELDDEHAPDCDTFKHLRAWRKSKGE